MLSTFSLNSIGRHASIFIVAGLSFLAMATPAFASVVFSQLDVSGGLGVTWGSMDRPAMFQHNFVWSGGTTVINSFEDYPVSSVGSCDAVFGGHFPSAGNLQGSIGGVQYVNAQTARLSDGGCLMIPSGSSAVLTNGETLDIDLIIQSNSGGISSSVAFYGSATDVISGVASEQPYSGSPTTADPNVADFAFALCDTSTCLGTVDFGTHFSSVVPITGTTTASTTFSTGYTLHVESDVVTTSSAFVRITYFEDNGDVSYSGLFNPPVCSGNGTCVSDIPIDLSSTGDISFATSTTYISNPTDPTGGIGRRTISVQLMESCYFGFSSCPVQNLSSQSVNATSQFVIVQESYVDKIADLVASTTIQVNATSTNGVIQYCSPFSFNFQPFACAFALVVPDASNTRSLSLQAVNTFEISPPFSWAFDVISDFASTSPVLPPAIVYTFGSSSPAILQGDTISFQIYASSSNILPTIYSDQPIKKNIWDIVDPYFTLVVGVAVLFEIISLLFGIEFVKHQSDVEHEQLQESHDLITDKNGKLYDGAHEIRIRRFRDDKFTIPRKDRDK